MINAGEMEYLLQQTNVSVQPEASCLIGLVGMQWNVADCRRRSFSRAWV
jgi:hypothetical protein